MLGADEEQAGLLYVWMENTENRVAVRTINVHGKIDITKIGDENTAGSTWLRSMSN